MNIKHHPHFNTMIISKHYSQKDDVPLTYVCTSAPNKNADYAADIFYRETPHPDYGNRYLGVYRNGDNQVMITNCDTIEDLKFTMIEGPDGWEYSQHRHDYRQVGDYAIDGGRAYPRLISSTNTITVLEIKRMKVKNGVFEEVVNVSST